MSIKDNLKNIKSTLAKHVTLVAVSKTKPISDLFEAYNAGQRVFGENKIQEMAAKYDALPKDIAWHMIGHVQKNKVKYMAPFVSLIHGVENLKLLEEINKQALKHDRIIDCLLQIYIADEDTKYGLDFAEAIELLRSDTFESLKNIRIVGLMGIATYTDNQKKIAEEFYELRTLFKGLKESFFKESAYFKELSMGMSADYTLAIEQGSTMIRLGSTIFGERIYTETE